MLVEVKGNHFNFLDVETPTLSFPARSFSAVWNQTSSLVALSTPLIRSATFVFGQMAWCLISGHFTPHEARVQSTFTHFWWGNNCLCGACSHDTTASVEFLLHGCSSCSAAALLPSEKQAQNSKVQTNSSPLTRAITTRCWSAVACCRGNYLLPPHSLLTTDALTGSAGMCSHSPCPVICSRGPAHTGDYWLWILGSRYV